VKITGFAKISTKSRIDKDNGVLAGVSVISCGQAVGHDLVIDSRTLEQVKELGAQFNDGLKVRMNHPKKGQEAPVQSIIGCLKNFRVEGKKTCADLHLLKSDEHYDKIIEMAEKMPENFGLSIVFSGKPEQEEDISLARIQEIYACDLVDDPAANVTGLFSRGDFAVCEHCGKAAHLCSCSAMSGDDHYSEYGDVPYADSENHKYPVDKPSHVRAAWSYINMPRNAKKYDSDKLEQVKSKIKAAAKKHGVKISDKSQQSTNMNEEQIKLAKSLGLADDATLEDLTAALSRLGFAKKEKMAEIEDEHEGEGVKKNKKEKKDEDYETDSDMSTGIAALRQELSKLALRMDGQDNVSKQQLAKSQKAEIETLLSEAAGAGKVVPFDADDLFTDKDGTVTIKMLPVQLAKVISKLPAGQVKTTLSKPELAKDSNGKIIDRRSKDGAAQLVAFNTQRNEENALKIGRSLKTLSRN
jgi:hypothetical protein